MTTRSLYFFGIVIVSVILSASIYFQIADGIEPCPLCTLQRIAFFLLGLVFLAGLLVWTRRLPRLFINLASAILSLLGILFAGRQVWLQNFPPADNTECGVSLQYMMQVLPVNEVVMKIFAGTAECTQRGWELLHLNMAEWSLLWFLVLFLLTVALCFREFRQPR